MIDEDGYETLRATGVVRGDPSRMSPDVEEAYAFMRVEHARRVPGSAGGPLLWAWARTTRRHLVETVRQTARCRERPQVLLTCRVPRQGVLLSEFGAWRAHPRGSTWQGCVELLETGDVLDAVELCPPPPA